MVNSCKLATPYSDAHSKDNSVFLGEGGGGLRGGIPTQG